MLEHRFLTHRSTIPSVEGISRQFQRIVEIPNLSIADVPGCFNPIIRAPQFNCLRVMSLGMNQRGHDTDDERDEDEPLGDPCWDVAHAGDDRLDGHEYQDKSMDPCLVSTLPLPVSHAPRP
jgi:hypothetical protein